jgi:type IV secretory pathway VirB6-like protein
MKGFCILKSFSLLAMLVLLAASPAQAGKIGGLDPISSPGYKPVAAAACNQLKANSNGSYLRQIVNLSGRDFKVTGERGTFCPCAPEPGMWLERVVFCFASVPYGLIYNITQNLVKSVMPFFTAVYGALAMLAIIIFGYKLSLGMLRDVKVETFTFLLKLGGVMSFLFLFPKIHEYVLLATQGLAEIPSNAISSFATICPSKAGVNANIWAQWDCIMGNLLGVSVVDPTKKFIGTPVFMGITGIIGAFLYNLGWGTLIVIAGLYILMTLMFAVMRMVTVYLLAVIAVSFLSILGLIFVPLLLFKNTMPSYSVWLQIILSYMLQPMLLVLFMGIMMVALDFAVFKGSGSLSTALTNRVHKQGQMIGEAMFSDPGAGKDLTKQFSQKSVEVYYVLKNPELAPADPNASSDAYKYGLPEGYGGIFGQLPTVDPNVFKNKGAVPVTSKVVYPDEEELVIDLKGRPNAVDKNLTPPKYQKKVFVSFLSTCMLVFVMFTMLGNIPKISSDLAGTAGGNLATVKSLGEDQIKKAIALVREGAKLAIDIKTGGALSKMSASTGGKGNMGDLVKMAYQNAIGKSSTVGNQ